MAGPQYGRLLTDLTVNGLGLTAGTGTDDGQYIIIGTTAAGLKSVIYYGAIVDAAETTFAPGSFGMDPAGQFGVVDSNGAWQVVTLT